MLVFEQQRLETANNDIEPNDNFNFRRWSIALVKDLHDMLHASFLLTRSILRVIERLLSGIIYLTK
ncbi:hypothetical protein PS15p_208814 [Mucor circinelloides]